MTINQIFLQKKMKKLNRLLKTSPCDSEQKININKIRNKDIYIMHKCNVAQKTQNGNIFAVKYENQDQSSMITLKTSLNISSQFQTLNKEKTDSKIWYNSNKHKQINSFQLESIVKKAKQEQQTAEDTFKKCSIKQMKKGDQTIKFRKHKRFKTVNILDSILSDEVYKQDTSYDFRVKMRNRNTKKTLKKPKINIHFPSSSLQGITKKNQEYLDRRAIQAQAYFKQPLQLRYGNKYFQYLVRDRYKDELPLNSFVYQIKDKISSTKFINKIYESKPYIKKKQKLVLKGIKPFHKPIFLQKVNNKLQQMKKYETINNS